MWHTDEAALSVPTTAEIVEVDRAATSMFNVAPGKRRRDMEESYVNGGSVVTNNHEIPPHKRVRGSSDGVPEAVRSVVRTCHKPETRIPQEKNSRSKEAGHGAELLVTPIAQGMYHHSSLGPDFQQGWTVTTAQGQQLPSAEERVEEEALHHVDSTVQQQAEDNLFRFPRNFDEGYRALLAATETERENQAVPEIRCRLCPNTGFSTWADFKRHCETTEAHPLRISFCDYCGDFFARSDALKRHYNKPPVECLVITKDIAEVKRRETERVHKEFLERLVRSLVTGEEIGMPFAQVIKNMYPKSSKKRTNSGWEQNVLQA